MLYSSFIISAALRFLNAEIWDLYNENRELLGKDHIRGEQLTIEDVYKRQIYYFNENGLMEL